MNRTMLSAAVVCLVGAILCGGALADPMSREQGEAVINELRQIRLLLEKQQKQAPPAQPSQPEKVRLQLGREYSLGKDDAPLVMLEYTDYQCPFCNRFTTTTFPELKKLYIDTGKLRFISRDFPLEFHPHAMKAAEAVRCAGDQEKFWVMKESLMTNSAKLTPELITALAREAGLDMEKFTGCMESGRHLAGIRERMAAATSVGINGTPTFVVGMVKGDYLEGYKIIGAQPFAAFDGLLKELLARGGQ